MEGEILIKKALISVYDKNGLDSILFKLNDLGIQLYSTGGTEKFIRDLGIPVIPIEDLTIYPSILGGRVKTLHPKVFGGILGRRDEKEDVEEMKHYQIPSFDLVVVNLYPFQETVEAKAKEEDIIEKIDIGGISLIRAGAKNFKHVCIIPSKTEYPELEKILVEGKTNEEERKKLAQRAFQVSTEYDHHIWAYFNSNPISSDPLGFEMGNQINLENKYISRESNSNLSPKLDPLSHQVTSLIPDQFTRPISHQVTSLIPDQVTSLIPDQFTKPTTNPETHPILNLRYGENPHQKGYFQGKLSEVFEQVHGKEISYNNLVDIDACIELIREFDEPSFGIIKHNNPCGLSSRSTILEAWKCALASDPVSAFGGVLISNSTIDLETAKNIDNLFFEVLISPKFEPEALHILKGKKNRILLVQKQNNFSKIQYKSLLNGSIIQEKDVAIEFPSHWKIVSHKSLEENQKLDLYFALKIVKHAKSNAIVLAKDRQILGIGVGQTSRVDALEQAIAKAHHFGFDLKGSSMASDAFFPFPDCVEIAAKAGISAIIQPGGSIKDELSTEMANNYEIAMVHSSIRHFKH